VKGLRELLGVLEAMKLVSFAFTIARGWS